MICVFLGCGLASVDSLLLPPVVLKSARPQSPFFGSPYKTTFLPSGQVWLNYYAHADGFLLRFPGLADFELDALATSAICWPAPDATAATLDHLFMNQVVPLAMAQQGYLVLHASAAMVQGRAVGFVGDSGMGKSTLAAHFASLQMPSLTDDGLVVDMRRDFVRVLPGPPSIRVWADTASALQLSDDQKQEPVQFTSKARYSPDAQIAVRASPCNLSEIYLLRNGGATTPQVLQVRQVQAVVQLLNNSFLLDTRSPRMLERQFEQLTELVKRVPISSLDYARDYSMLPAISDLVVSRINIAQVVLQ
jgi:energy-coupling factor transporter ATP-binding protein EcfA2